MKKVTVFITGISVLMFGAFVFGIKDYAKANKNNAINNLYSKKEKPQEKNEFKDIDMEDFSRKRIDDSPQNNVPEKTNIKAKENKKIIAPPKKFINHDVKNQKIEEPIIKNKKSAAPKFSKINLKNFSRAPLRMIPEIKEEIKPTKVITKDSL